PELDHRALFGSNRRLRVSWNGTAEALLPDSLRPDSKTDESRAADVHKSSRTAKKEVGCVWVLHFIFNKLAIDMTPRPGPFGVRFRQQNMALKVLETGL